MDNVSRACPSKLVFRDTAPACTSQDRRSSPHLAQAFLSGNMSNTSFMSIVIEHYISSGFVTFTRHYSLFLSINGLWLIPPATISEHS